MRQRLKTKAEEFGGQLIEVDPAYTSQTCPSCGHVNRDNRKTQAQFSCNCGFSEHADIVGATNILARGFSAGAPPGECDVEVGILQSARTGECGEEFLDFEMESARSSPGQTGADSCAQCFRIRDTVEAMQGNRQTAQERSPEARSRIIDFAVDAR
jgi:predicted RNA-binding Zn-ribbon protein involved in translation (DUF1610 family)